MHFLLAAACLLQDTPTPYSFKGEAFQACECASYCPCMWMRDATADQCRSLVVWKVNEGKYGDTRLGGVTFVLALTKTGKNLIQAMGQWEGTIYVSDQATEEQKKAVEDFVRMKWGKSFSTLKIRTEVIEVTIEGETRSLMLGKIAQLRVAPVKMNGGKPCVIENPPFCFYGKMTCAKAKAHTFSDGADRWDFTGRCAFYGPFEYVQD